MSMTPHRRFLYAIPLLCVLLFTLLLVSCGGESGVTTPAATDTGNAGGTTAPPATTTRVTRTTAPPTDIERPSPTPDYFTVTFDPANGKKCTTVQVKNDRLPVTLPKAPTREGKVFVGWYLDAPLYTRPYRGEMIVADTLLTARYATVAYTVTFHVGEGAVAEFEASLVPGGAPVPDYPSVSKRNASVSMIHFDLSDLNNITYETVEYPLAYSRYLKEIGDGLYFTVRFTDANTKLVEVIRLEESGFVAVAEYAFSTEEIYPTGYAFDVENKIIRLLGWKSRPIITLQFDGKSLKEMTE